MSLLHHDDVIIIRVSHMGRVNWYSGQSYGSGQLVFGSGQPIRAKKTRVTRGAREQIPRRRVRTCSTSDFDVVFTSGFVSSSSTQWYGQNTILTTFIFEQKSNTALNLVL